MLRSRLAALTAALVLAAPGAALAQSAGDEQYQDPFGDDQEQEQEQPQPTPQPDTSSSDDAGTTAQATPTPAATAATTATAPVSAAQDQLPRTGADAGLIALGGAVLLAGGLALRRRTSRAADSS